MFKKADMFRYAKKAAALIAAVSMGLPGTGYIPAAAEEGTVYRITVMGTSRGLSGRGVFLSESDEFIPGESAPAKAADGQEAFAVTDENGTAEFVMPAGSESRKYYFYAETDPHAPADGGVPFTGVGENEAAKTVFSGILFEGTEKNGEEEMTWDYKDPYFIRFLDHDGSLYRQYVVRKGQETSLPENPSRDGFRFTGWSAPVETPAYRNASYTAQYESTMTRVEMKFEDKSEDPLDLSEYDLVFDVDRSKGLDISLDEHYARMEAAGLKPSVKYTKLSGSQELYVIPVSHLTEKAHEQQYSEFKRIVKYVTDDGETLLGTSTETVTADTGHTTETDRATGKVTAEYNEDPYIEFPEREAQCPNPDYVAGTNTIPAYRKPASQTPETQEMVIRCHGRNTAAEKVTIRFEDTDEHPEDLSEYDMTIEVPGVHTQNGFICDAPVETGLEAVTSGLLRAGFRFEDGAAFPSVVTGTVKEYVFRVSHRTRKKTETYEYKTSRRYF